MKPTVLPPPEEIQRERSRRDFGHFADKHCQVLSETAGESADWVPFKLWPAQRDAARQFQDHRLVVILKARQLGLTWLALAFALWHVLLHPIATVLVFSRRDDEAVDLLARLKGMYKRLPPWLRFQRVVKDNDHEWELDNGSRVLAFPSTAGDSYTATLAIIDEADLTPDLDALMRAVKPTIDAGGKMLLVSRADKKKPESSFKKIYRAARAGESDWRPIFLPWNARPDRDAAWYETQRRDVLARTGSLDDLAEQYPTTDLEALSPRSLDKRLLPAWLQQCYVEQRPIDAEGAPAIPGLAVYAVPVPERKYVLGADPAEGNPTSDDSALTVLDCETGEEVAALAGRFEPAVFASHAYVIAKFFNRAAILCERNNHGHAVLLWLRDHGEGVRLLRGKDDKDGWLSSTLGKTAMYDNCADACKNAEVILHSFTTYMQLSSIDGSTLRAPDGQMDDRADGFALAVCGRLAERSRPWDDALPFTFDQRFGRRRS
jgi:hypothetical protein